MDVFKIAITPVALVVGTLIGSRRLRLNSRTDLGIRTPSVRDAIIYSAAFLALVALAELMFWAAGEDVTPSSWRNRYGPAALALRIVFAGLIYPVAEELFFRGLLLGAITRRAGPLSGIVATAVLFTVLHTPQAPSLGALQIFVDGLFFAFVRLRSGSLLLPAAFHVVGNTFAVLQRL
jgi:hypothetical protein